MGAFGTIQSCEVKKAAKKVGGSHAKKVCPSLRLFLKSFSTRSYKIEGGLIRFMYSVYLVQGIYRKVK